MAKKYIHLEKGGSIVATPKTGVKNTVKKATRNAALSIVEAPGKAKKAIKDNVNARKEMAKSFKKK